MTVENCPKCGGTHYGSHECPFTDEQIEKMLGQPVTKIPEDEKPDWPPVGPAFDLPEGTMRHGSTGQLFEVKNRQWVRVRDEGRPVPHHGSGP